MKQRPLTSPIINHIKYITNKSLYYNKKVLLLNITQHTPTTQFTGGPRTPGIFPALSGGRRLCRRMIKSKFQIHNSPDGIYKVDIPQRPHSNRQTPWRTGSPHGRPTATPDVHSKQVRTRVSESKLVRPATQLATLTTPSYSPHSDGGSRRSTTLGGTGFTRHF